MTSTTMNRNFFNFSWFKKIINDLEKKAHYKRTVRELESLSDYELKDIGLTRGQIKSVAMEIYYDNLDPRRMF